MTGRSTFAAHSLAVQLARRGHLARSIEANVTAAGFRITAKQVLEAMGVTNEHVSDLRKQAASDGRETAKL